MAKQCCVCGSRLSFMNSGTARFGKYPEYEFCADCDFKYRRLSDAYSDSDYETYYNHFKRFIETPSVPQEIKDKITGTRERRKLRDEQRQRKEEEQQLNQAKERDRRERVKNMLLTSCDALEGYNIKYLGLVSQDSLFESGPLGGFSSSEESTNYISEESADSVSASDAARAVLFKCSEHGFVAEKVDDAKKQVLYKLSVKAANAGANAIIGMHIDVDFPVPTQPGKLFDFLQFAKIIKVSAYGTAVYVEKKDSV